jgi:hypothetical protein
MKVAIICIGILSSLLAAAMLVIFIPTNYVTCGDNPALPGTTTMRKTKNYFGMSHFSVDNATLYMFVFNN